MEQSLTSWMTDSCLFFIDELYCVFSSIMNLSIVLGGRVRVWRHLRYRMFNCCIVQHHTGSTLDVILSVSFPYCMNCWYVHQPVLYLWGGLTWCFPYIQCSSVTVYSTGNERRHIPSNIQLFYLLTISHCYFGSPALTHLLPLSQATRGPEKL